MITVGTNFEQSFQRDRHHNHFPTAAYVAARLRKIGWETEYARNLINNFREELIRECGEEYPEVLRHLRFISG